MKKQSLTRILAALGCIFLLATIGCNSQDPVSYNNKIMDVLNGSTDDMDALNDAMVKEDYSEAETVRKSWEAKLVKASETLKGIGDFKGNSDFKNTAVKAIDSYKNSVSNDYKQLIELRTSLKTGTKVDEGKIDTLLNKINQDFEKAANELNAASDKFEKDFNK
ncbi:ErpY-like lipoprotein [Leptospira sp. FAT2]|uniref:LIC11966 family lipoprotein n=1 Tax=Leptospira sanjuanensis TaxID=2879643 RepID=UPI001EE92A3E|nr:ErpY-like lipoprotein [Leptospira sanjuanensis]MCG6193515.1 ErpY-like lipoprotein [Leptospira sanjuanensis]